MFYAAHVALFKAAIVEPGMVYKTHSGLISAFSKELVLTGAINGRFGRALAKVHDVRLLADYAGDPPSRDTAAWAIEQAEAFVSSITKGVT